MYICMYIYVCMYVTQYCMLDMLVVPVGGGGLISGTAIAMKELNKNIKIIGVEPEKIPTMYKNVVKNEVGMHKPVSTIADGINVCDTNT